MDFTIPEIALLALVGIIAGLLPSTIAERRGIRLAADIGAGVAGVFVAAWLVAAWHDLDRFLTTPAGKPPEKNFVDVKPGFEPVILPLAPLKPLLKPVVYRSREEICDALVQSALNNDLPVPFFIRLLYQESTFRPAAISSAGALGIAQFMPETAAHRRLDNPFDPGQAIPASAKLLRDHVAAHARLDLRVTSMDMPHKWWVICVLAFALPLGLFGALAGAGTWSLAHGWMSSHDGWLLGGCWALTLLCAISLLDGCTLAVTVEPCTMCAGAIGLARVRRVVFGAWEPKTGAAGSLWDVLRDRRQAHRPEVVSGVLAQDCAAVLESFFAGRR